MNVVEDSLVAVVQEANSVSGNDNDWWFDTGATIHICKDRNLFKSYEVNKGEADEVTGANKVPSKVLGKGTIELPLTSGKVLTLVNVCVRIWSLDTFLTKKDSRWCMSLIS